MRGNCSSNSENGCAGCAPLLGLFILADSTGAEKTGYGCLDNSSSKVYASKSITNNSNGNSSGSAELSCPPLIPKPPDTSICNSSSTYTYSGSFIFTINDNGDIVVSGKESESYSEEPCFCSGYAEYVGYFAEPSTGCGSFVPCNVDGPAGSCHSSESSETFTTCTTSTSISAGSWNLSLFGCCEFDPGCCDEFDCPRASSVRGGSSATYSNQTQTKLSEEKDLAFFYGLCKKSVDIKMNKKTDSDWGPMGKISIPSSNLDNPEATSTLALKVRVKAITDKDFFDKKFKSISGKIYIFTEEASGKNPCCGGDYDGTIVRAVDYSISAGDTFKDYYYASDFIEFDNSDPDITDKLVIGCATVNQIEFL